MPPLSKRKGFVRQCIFMQVPIEINFIGAISFCKRYILNVNGIIFQTVELKYNAVLHSVKDHIILKLCKASY